LLFADDFAISYFNVNALQKIIKSNVNKSKILVYMKAGGLCMAAELADKVTLENRRGWNKRNIIKR
jgi:hypothetical protein